MKMEKTRILVVDDIPTNIMLIKAIIKKTDAECETAQCGSEALAKVESFKPHVVLLDLMMPDIDGWEIIRQLRGKYSKEQMAIIVTSAISDHDNVADCFKLGVNDYIEKPIVSARLLDTIKIHTQRLQK